MAHYQHLPLDNLDHRPTDRGHQRRNRRMSKLVGERKVPIRKRVVAAAIDLFIAAVFTYGFSFWSVGLMGFDPDDISDKSPPAALSFGAALIGLIVFGVIGEIIFMVSSRRTIGKRLMGLSVADGRLSRSSAPKLQLVKRTLAKAFLLYGIGIGVPLVLGIVAGSGVLVFAAFLVVGLALFFMMLGIGTDNRRGIHDRISGTEVIMH